MIITDVRNQLTWSDICDLACDGILLILLSVLLFEFITVNIKKNICSTTLCSGFVCGLVFKEDTTVY